MSKITVTLRDEKKRTELLELLTALPYVASAHWDVAEEATNGHYAQALREASFGGDDEESPFYHDPRTQLMDREIAAFEAMQTALVTTYPEQYVAIFQGAVVDHDADKARLLARIDQSYPDDVVLIRQVHHTPRPPFRLRSPRLQRS